MTEFDTLRHALSTIAGIGPEDFQLSEDHWQVRTYKKAEFYNEYRNVCKYLGFIIDGVFRTYYADEETGEEKNVFFFSKNQVIVSYKSFIDQAPCNYYTQSLTESRILYIHYDHLMALYRQSHQWEHLGRIIAERAFSASMTRTENALFLTPEQRYLNLIEDHPDIFNAIPLYHISSYLGIQLPSLSRIRKRISSR